MSECVVEEILLSGTEKAKEIDPTKAGYFDVRRFRVRGKPGQAFWQFDHGELFELGIPKSLSKHPKDPGLVCSRLSCRRLDESDWWEITCIYEDATLYTGA